MTLEQLTSAIYNNVVSGLKGTNVNVPITHEHIEDSIINERLLIIKEYMIKGILPRKDFLVPIPCITLDCQPIEKCPITPPNCGGNKTGTNYLHFEIPQVIQDFGEEAIEYIGSKDRMNPFKIYIDNNYIYNTFRTRRASKPFVWIDMVPNVNNKYDGYVFNAPMMKELTAILIPKDPRQLSEFSCCTNDTNSFSFFAGDIEKRVSEKFLRYFRQLVYIQQPGDNSVKP
jgi:hypothetical protein